jgi:hypothetical protein
MLMAGLLLAGVLSSHAAESSATLKAIDLYRSNRLTVAKVREAAGPALDNFLRQRTEKARKEIESKARGAFPGYFFALSENEYVTDNERKHYVTFDVVDPEDAASRMPFFKAPQGKVPDPDGVLSHWRQYAALGEAASRKGEVTAVEHPSCPGFYCLWGAPTPEAASLEQSFVAAAALRREELQQAQAQEADAASRAAAVYVLSYSTDGAVAVEAALSALRDPAEQVRAAGLLVLADVALYHKGAFVDVSRVLPVLDYPTVAERSKALSVLVGLVDNPNYKTYLVSRAGPFLLALLRLRQPANHDLAFTLLATLSGKSFSPDDYDSWTKWAEGQATSPQPVLSGVSVETR